MRHRLEHGVYVVGDRLDMKRVDSVDTDFVPANIPAARQPYARRTLICRNDMVAIKPSTANSSQKAGVSEALRHLTYVAGPVVADRGGSVGGRSVAFGSKRGRYGYDGHFQ